jgi:choline monooxygenase
LNDLSRTELEEIKRGYDTVASRSWSLNAKAYIDPRFVSVEKQAIFYRTWQFVCHIEKLRLPGQYITLDVYGQSIVVLRDSNLVLRAFYNVCKHRGHELLSGEGQKKLIVCPYHAWSYALEGQLKAARLTEDVENFNKDEVCLDSVQVEEFCSFVFVNLDTNAEPLAKQSGNLGKEIESFAPDLGSLTFAHRLSYRIQANWKTVIDNFLECYHCPTAHRDFVSLVDMDTYEVTTQGIYSSHMAKAGLSENSAYAVEGASVTDHAVWFLWPNLTLMRYPGRGNFMVWKIIPAGPEETYEEFDFFFETNTHNEAEAEAIKYIDEVLQVEDIGLVESVQRGMRTPAFEQGRYVINHRKSGMSEHAVHHFHGLVLDAFEQYCNSEQKNG